MDPLLVAHFAHDPGAAPPLPQWGLPNLGMALSGLRGDVDLMAGLSGLLPRGSGSLDWQHALGDALAGGLPGDGAWVTHPATWLMAVDAATGQRVAFGSPGAPAAPLGAAIAASWCIPGWFAPVEIDGREYVDGGAVSPTSADLLVSSGLDEVLVIAPMATAGGARARGWSRLERLMRHSMTARLDREIAALAAAGIRVVRVEPGPEELELMGANFMDRRRQPMAIAAGRAQAARVGL